jgi:8-oxo-dGTP pyrophosphatase MutT (NUDIX family)
MATLPLAMLRQAAVIPIREGRICLVTSRSGKRWVIPKGRLEPGATAGEIGLLEAWEEAGLVGSLQPRPVGAYLYEKYQRTHQVTVFLMHVLRLAKVWPECARRTRRWLRLRQAVACIAEPGLRKLMSRIQVSDVAAGRLAKAESLSLLKSKA